MGQTQRGSRATIQNVCKFTRYSFVLLVSFGYWLGIVSSAWGQSQVTPPPASSEPSLSPSPKPSPSPSPAARSETRVRIAEVVVKGVEGDLQTLVYKTVKTAPGRVTTRSQLQKDIEAIFATGYFSNVRAVPEDTPLGVRVMFEVKLNPVLRKVQVEGAQVIPRSVVEDAFKVQYGTTLNLKQLQVGIQKIEQWYQTKGYVLAQVIGSPKVSGDGVVTLEMVENAIEEIQVKYLDREGNDRDAQGKPFLAKTPSSIVLQQVQSKPGDIFNRFQVEKDLRQIFENLGFDDVRLSLQPGQNPRKVTLVINVTNNDEVERMINLGKRLEAKKTFTALQQAIAKYNQARQLYQKAGDTVGEISISNRIGNLYYELEDFPQAKKAYKQVLATAQKQSFPILEGITWSNIGNIYSSIEEYQMAFDVHERALALLADTKKLPTQDIKGNFVFRFGQSTRRGRFFDLYITPEGFDETRSGAYQSIKTLMYLRMGMLYLSLGDYQQALYSFNETLDQWQFLNRDLKKNEPMVEILRAVNQLAIGCVYSDLGEQEQANTYIRRSQQIINDLKPIFASNRDSKEPQDRFASIVFAFAPVLISCSGKSNQTASFYQWILDFYTKYQPENLQLIARTLISLGDEVSKTGKKDDALKFYQQALRILELQQNNTRQNQGNIDLDNIRNQRVSGANLAPRPSKPSSENTTNSQLEPLEVGTASETPRLLTDQQLAQIAQQFRLSSEQTEREDFLLIKADAYNSIGSLYQDLNQVEEAQKSHQEALDLINRFVDKNLLKSKEFLARGRIQKVKTLNLIAKTYARDTQHDSALSRLKEAWNLIEEIRNSAQPAELPKIADHAAESLLGLATVERDQGNLTQAQTWIEIALERVEARSPLPFEGVAHSPQSSSSVLEASKFKPYKELVSYYAAKRNYYDFYIDLLMQQYRRTKAEQYKILALQVSERFRARNLLLQPSTFAEIQPMLDEQTILLEYALGEKQSYLWIITRNGIFAEELPGRVAIEEYARDFYKYLTEPGLRVRANKTAQASLQLSQKLIPESIIKQLPQKRLVVVSDGFLQYIPFSALPVPNPALDVSDPNLADKITLLLDNQKEMISLPSASTLAVIRQNEGDRIQPTQTLAVLANPVFARPTEISTVDQLYPNLQETHTQAEQIFASLPEGDRSRSRQEYEYGANRQTALSLDITKYRILHFATHGILDTQQPERSGMILSVVNSQNELQRSLLSPADIFNVFEKHKLSAELVVLSGCRTGLGTGANQEVKGEGLIGLTGSFFYAGAKRVVASLWSVDNEATTELMKLFYGKMFAPDPAKRLSPTTALREAQLEMMKNPRWQAPYYWAGFIIQGEWKSTD